MCRHYANLLEDYSSPVEGSKQLKFDSQYPKPMMTQFWAILAKYTAAYWRMPEYNGIRILLALAVGFTFGAMFWRWGDKVCVPSPTLTCPSLLHHTPAGKQGFSHTHLAHVMRCVICHVS